MSEKNIYQRMHACMKDVSYVRKQKGGKGMPYSFASHDAVTKQCRAAFVEHGVFVETSVISWEQDGNRTSVDLRLEFVNVDDPEERISIMSFGFGIDQQGKGPGKAISYAYKYGLLKGLALETGDDPESDNVDHVSDADKKKAAYKQLRDSTPAPKGAVDAALAEYVGGDLKAASTADIDQALIDADERFGQLLHAAVDRMEAS